MPALVQSIKPLDFVAVKMVRLDLEGRMRDSTGGEDERQHRRGGGKQSHCQSHRKGGYGSDRKA
jgi:hypothetical protein